MKLSIDHGPTQMPQDGVQTRDVAVSLKTKGGTITLLGYTSVDGVVDVETVFPRKNSPKTTRRRTSHINIPTIIGGLRVPFAQKGTRLAGLSAEVYNSLAGLRFIATGNRKSRSPRRTVTTAR